MNDGNGNLQNSSFSLNGPTIIALLYLASFVLGVTGIIGLVLAYIWKGESRAPWEASHYRFHIRTFWIAFIGSIVGLLLLLIGIGFLIMLVIGIWVIVRSVVALLKAQKAEAIADPGTWTI